VAGHGSGSGKGRGSIRGHALMGWTADTRGVALCTRRSRIDHCRESAFAEATKLDKFLKVSETNTHQEAFDETRGPALQQVKSSSAHTIYIQLIIDPGVFDGGPLCV
jgi:hypothetical protein